MPDKRVNISLWMPTWIPETHLRFQTWQILSNILSNFKKEEEEENN